MSEPQKFYNVDGEEVQAIPKEEVEKIQEEKNALIKEKEELLAEKKRLEDGDLSKTENLHKLRTFSEAKEKELETLTKRINDKEEYDKKSTKEALISHYAGSDEESRKKLESEYGFINLDESTPENIATRMEKAARVSGLYKETNTQNPVFQGVWGGSAPHLKPIKPADDADNVLETPKGKSALSAMGIPEDYGKKK